MRWSRNWRRTWSGTPALWPETYSYTLSIALHLGLPVVVPDIGAFVERVQGRPLSVICPWGQSSEQWSRFWSDVAADAGLPESGERSPEPAVERDFYARDYLAGVPPKEGRISATLAASLADNYRAASPALSRRERLLGRLWRVSRSPVVAGIVSLVPFRLKRAIKRRLSSRPMHDIVRGE